MSVQPVKSAFSASRSFEENPEVSSEPVVALASATEIPIPAYLESAYWWAYVRPWAVRLFERAWLVDLILWGNYRQLRDAALSVLGEKPTGRTLQVACVYGDLTSRLSRRIAACGGALDVVDVLKVQLENLRCKTQSVGSMRLLNMDSSDMDLSDASYDRVLLFFLLHEQPNDVRQRTLAEAYRVLKPGGIIHIVDFARPKWWQPLRYLWLPVLGVLEPFAADLWRHHDVRRWLPEFLSSRMLKRQLFFGDMYQLMSIRKD